MATETGLVTAEPTSSQNTPTLGLEQGPASPRFKVVRSLRPHIEGVPAMPAETPLAFDVDSIAAANIDEAPEVQIHVVEQHEREQAQVPVDSEGVPFDSAIHSTGADGSGVKTAKGSWRKRRGAGGRAKSGAPQSSISSAPSGTTTEAAAKATGAAFAQMTIMLGAALGGPEWANGALVDEKGKSVQDDAAMLTEAYTAYCAAKDLKDIPPGVALTFALFLYAAPRFAMPQTQARAGRVKTWLALRVAKFKVKRQLKKAGVKAHVTIGEHGGHKTILIDGQPAK